MSRTVAHCYDAAKRFDYLKHRSHTATKVPPPSVLPHTEKEQLATAMASGQEETIRRAKSFESLTSWRFGSNPLRRLSKSLRPSHAVHANSSPGRLHVIRENNDDSLANRSSSVVLASCVGLSSLVQSLALCARRAESCVTRVCRHTL